MFWACSVQAPLYLGVEFGGPGCKARLAATVQRQRRWVGASSVHDVALEMLPQKISASLRGRCLSLRDLHPTEQHDGHAKACHRQRPVGNHCIGVCQRSRANPAHSQREQHVPQADTEPHLHEPAAKAFSITRSTNDEIISQRAFKFGHCPSPDSVG